MFDYGLGYRSLCQSSLQQELSFIEKQIKSFPLFEKLLGFTFSLNNAMGPVYRDITNKIAEPKHLNTSDKLMAEGAIVGLCGLNIHSIWHALRPLEQNSIQNCANMIRPVYESIPKMFYVLHHPEKIWEILSREEFGLWLTQKLFFEEVNQVGISKKYKQINPRVCSDDYEYLYLKCYLTHNPEGKTFQDRLKMNVSKTAYKKFRGKYNNDWFRKQIYTEESLALQNTSYASLSMHSHANFVRSRMPIEYHPVMTPQFFKILTDLAFFNLYVYFNAAHEKINQIGEWHDTLDFITNTQQELKSHFAMTNMYPDVPEYVESLTLHPEKNTS